MKISLFLKEKYALSMTLPVLSYTHHTCSTCEVPPIAKNKILPFVTTWTNLEGIMLNKVDRERQIPRDFIYMLNF